MTINEALKYYKNDEDKAIKRLIEIYNAIGDHPNVVVKKILRNLWMKYDIQKSIKKR